MKANLKSTGKILIAASVLGVMGSLGNPALGADREYGYCGVAQCLSKGDANFFESFLGLGEAKLSWWDCRVQRECLAVSDEIQKLAINEKDCDKDKLEQLRSEIQKVDTKLQEILHKADPESKTATVESQQMKKGLERDLMLHFGRCYTEGIFKPNSNVCISNACDNTVAKIEKLTLNENDCTKAVESLYPNKKSGYSFDFEVKLVKTRLDTFKEKCVSENLRPAAKIYGRAILQKDLAFGQECQKLAGELQKETANTKVTRENCTFDLYNKLNGQVKNLKVDFQKLDTYALPYPSSEKNPPQITDELSAKIDKHFVQCESEKLFPPDTTKCLSDECKAIETKIAAFKVDREECQKAPASLNKQTHFGYEQALVENMLADYAEKCKEGDGLPYAQVGQKWLYKSEYEAEKKSLEDKIAGMGRHGEMLPSNKRIKMMTYDELKSRINGLQLNRRYCSNRRNLTPLELNVQDYKAVWKEADFEPPQQLQELSDKLEKFKAECIAKKLYR